MGAFTCAWAWEYVCLTNARYASKAPPIYLVLSLPRRLHPNFCPAEFLKKLFWKEEMELTLVGLENSGKTTFVNVLAVRLKLCVVPLRLAAAR